MLLYLIVLVCLHLSFADDQTDLVKHILSKTSPVVRPVLDEETAVNLTFGFTLKQIIDLNEHAQHLTVKLWLRMNWVNELTVWDPSDHANLTTLRINQGDIWTPDIFLEDDVSDEVSQGTTGYQTQVIVKNDGRCNWMVPVKVSTACRVDVTEFPFDHQICQLVFLSWTHNGYELDMWPDTETNPITPFYLNSTEWILNDVVTQRIPIVYDCCPEPYINLKYTIVLMRRSLFHTFFLILPCFLQMALILSTFFLPIESGERIGVIITILLVFAVYLQVLGDSLPESSTSTPMLSRFLIVTMTESAILLIVNFFIMNVYFKGSTMGAGHVPLWMQDFVLVRCGKLVFIHYDKEQCINYSGSTQDKNSKENGMQYFPNENDDLDKSSLEMEKPKDRLLEEVLAISDHIREMNLTDEIEEEWKVLARVLNRICFILFVLIFLVSSIAILLKPFGKELKHHQD